MHAMKRRRMERTALWAGLLLLGMTGAGCQAVKPWQRGQLADPLIKPDRDPWASPWRSTSSFHVRLPWAGAAWGAVVAGAIEWWPRAGAVVGI